MKNDNADSAQTDHLVLDSLESLQEGFLPVFRLIHHIVDVPPCDLLLCLMICGRGDYSSESTDTNTKATRRERNSTAVQVGILKNERRRHADRDRSQQMRRPPNSCAKRFQRTQHAHVCIENNRNLSKSTGYSL